MISIHNLSVTVDNKSVLRDITMTLQQGTTTVLMGPNGSGKSSLANVLAGNPEYACVGGSLEVDGTNFLSLSVHERSLQGLLVLFQHTPAIPGLFVFSFLKEAVYVRTKKHLDVALFESQLFEYLDFLGLNRAFLYRGVHDGFSGGEKKRFELLQLLVLRPRWIILDEIDSGLDIDALKLVKDVLDILKKENPELIVLCITHYQRMAHYLQPSQVYVLNKGELVDSGDYTLVERIEADGYQRYV